MELDQDSIKRDGFPVLALVFVPQQHKLLVVLGGYSCPEDLTEQHKIHLLQRLWQIEREVLYQGMFTICFQIILWEGSIVQRIEQLS